MTKTKMFKIRIRDPGETLLLIRFKKPRFRISLNLRSGIFFFKLIEAHLTKYLFFDSQFWRKMKYLPIAYTKLTKSNMKQRLLAFVFVAQPARTMFCNFTVEESPPSWNLVMQSVVL